MGPRRCAARGGRTLDPALTLIFAFAGTMVIENQTLHIIFLVFFGIVGYVAKKLKFDVAPMAMAFIDFPVAISGKGDGPFA